MSRITIQSLLTDNPVYSDLVSATIFIHELWRITKGRTSLRASGWKLGTIFYTSEKKIKRFRLLIDHTIFFTGEKNCLTNQIASCQ